MPKAIFIRIIKKELLTHVAADKPSRRLIWQNLPNFLLIFLSLGVIVKQKVLICYKNFRLLFIKAIFKKIGVINLQTKQPIIFNIFNHRIFATLIQKTITISNKNVKIRASKFEPLGIFGEYTPIFSWFDHQNLFAQGFFMNMKYISACLLALVGLSSAHAATYTVYKTVGAHGEVKYSQQMPKDATKVEVIEFRTDGRQNTPGNMAPATVDPNATAEQNKLAEMERQMKEMQQKQQAQQCQSLQNSLNNLNMGGRIYEMNAQGERVFLSDADINARRATTQQAIAQYCSGK